MMSKSLILIIDNIRSSYNVGSILRTADGLGISKVYLCGITPHPRKTPDDRLPHIVNKVEKQITKTAIGAEKTVDWEYVLEIKQLINKLISEGFTIAALEQTDDAVDISTFVAPMKLAIVVGNEVYGVNKELIDLIKTHLFIPMKGSKESYNVAVATALAMYVLTLD